MGVSFSDCCDDLYLPQSTVSISGQGLLDNQEHHSVRTLPRDPDIDNPLRLPHSVLSCKVRKLSIYSPSCADGLVQEPKPETAGVPTNGTDSQLSDRCCSMSESDDATDCAFRAILSGDVPQLKKLLSQPACDDRSALSLNNLYWKQEPYSGYSVLQIAVISGCPEMVAFVLQNNVDLFSTVHIGPSALALAYDLNVRELVDLILVHAASQFSQSPTSPCASSQLSLTSKTTSALSTCSTNVPRLRGMSMSAVETSNNRVVPNRSRSLSSREFDQILCENFGKNRRSECDGVGPPVDSKRLRNPLNVEQPNARNQSDTTSVDYCTLESVSATTSASYISDITMDSSIRRKARRLSTKGARKAASRLWKFFRNK